MTASTDLPHDLRKAWLLGAAGFMATAVAFGPARMGFGQFLPIFRVEFGLSTSLAGTIASLGFLGFLIALPVSAHLAAKLGQRVPVLAGAVAAAAGFMLVAAAGSAWHLAAGITVAGASAGLCWAPFNDAAERVVPPHLQAVTLSAVATGTTIGVMAAGGLALTVIAGILPWRQVWTIFAAGAGVFALFALVGVPAGGGRHAAPGIEPGRLLRKQTLPIYVISLVYGATNAIYLSFAADRVVAAGGLAEPLAGSAPAVIFLCYGAFGLLGLATGAIERRIGLRRLIGGIFAAFGASVILISLLPGPLWAVILSAGLHGAAVMMISGVLSFWTLRVFPGRGSAGFTAALITAATGSVLGPAGIGLLMEVLGAETALLLSAAPAVALALRLFAGHVPRLRG